MEDWIEIKMICSSCKLDINCVVSIVEGWTASFLCRECSKKVESNDSRG